jgi:catechol-2,3-dioxygenase
MTRAVASRHQSSVWALHSPSVSRAGVPTQLGHVALRVTDLEQSIRFYRDVIGMTLRGQFEDKVAFLGIREDASHEIALFQLPKGAEGPDSNRVGMYHMAWEMASFEDLQQFHERLLAHNVRIAGYSDQQSNVMFLDPDGNELEAIWEPSPVEQERRRAAGIEALPRLKPSP